VPVSADRLMHRLRRAHAIAATVLALAFTAPSHAGSPWLEPGDVGLRHDIEMLVDEGVLASPVTVWPMSWPQIARDIEAYSDGAKLRPGLAAALERVRARARSESEPGTRLAGRVALSARPTELRTFADVPREEGELAGSFDWLGDRFAVRLEATAVANASDGKSLRPDGSYVGVTLGNWMLSAGYLEHWWGPGWEGSLILGNNARPFPGFAFDRKYADPFRSKWLSWIGPWSVNGYYGILDNDREDINRPHFLGLRITFKPFDAIEFGLMRTSQWCGEGRNCDWETFKNLITGNDNAGENVDPAKEPGNQMAGWDMRWGSPFGLGPWAVYYQEIGEDESHRKPIFKLRLAGLEFWGGLASGGTYRAHLEWANTDPACTTASGCAYRGGPYKIEGYSYYGRSLGHAMFHGGEMLSAGVSFVTAEGPQINGLIRYAQLNQRPGGRYHTVVDDAEDWWNVELSCETHIASGILSIGIGGDLREHADGHKQLLPRGFVNLRHEF
jgi:Capsule assembly protein Wzi